MEMTVILWTRDAAGVHLMMKATLRMFVENPGSVMRGSFEMQVIHLGMERILKARCMRTMRDKTSTGRTIMSLKLGSRLQMSTRIRKGCADGTARQVGKESAGQLGA